MVKQKGTVKLPKNRIQNRLQDINLQIWRKSNQICFMEPQKFKRDFSIPCNLYLFKSLTILIESPSGMKNIIAKPNLAA